MFMRAQNFQGICQVAWIHLGNIEYFNAITLK